MYFIEEIGDKGKLDEMTLTQFTSKAHKQAARWTGSSAGWGQRVDVSPLHYTLNKKEYPSVYIQKVEFKGLVRVF